MFNGVQKWAPLLVSQWEIVQLHLGASSSIYEVRGIEGGIELIEPGWLPLLGVSSRRIGLPTASATGGFAPLSQRGRAGKPGAKKLSDGGGLYITPHGHTRLAHQISARRHRALVGGGDLPRGEPRGGAVSARRLMQWWDAELAGVSRASNVLPLRGPASA